MTHPTRTAYYKYLMSLSKGKVLAIFSRYHRVNSANKSTPVYICSESDG